MILVLDRNKVIRSELSNDAPGTAVYFDDDHHSMEKNGYATYEFSCVAHHEAVVYLENEGYVSIKDSDGSRFAF
ncbi:hypothetical protein [Thalassobacillus sp. C254]|uniref:hypothetical protein n=1 Tax=Thalassobacillus sp. C254 TaxID=1225341 RepID=UPI0006D2B76F|nr:hypothetical protein [Thalassobacillus sp. C254]